MTEHEPVMSIVKTFSLDWELFLPSPSIEDQALAEMLYPPIID